MGNEIATGGFTMFRYIPGDHGSDTCTGPCVHQKEQNRRPGSGCRTFRRTSRTRRLRQCPLLLSTALRPPLVSYCQCNKLPQTSGFTKSMYFLLFLGVRSLKWVSLDSNHQQGPVFLEGLGETRFPFLSCLLVRPTCLGS